MTESGVRADEISSEVIDRVRETVREMMATHHVPGMTVGITSTSGMNFMASFGVADIETGAEMTPAHRHRIASVTKTMVGLCIMALVDEGKLSLDDRIVDLLPDLAFDGPADTMTVRHLLTHVSGMGEAANGAALADTVDPSRPPESEPREFAQMFAGSIAVECEPGAKWAYCNNGFGLLGEIIRRAEHAELDDVMRRRIFAPLGMDDTDCLDAADPRLSTGYHRPPTDDAIALLQRAGRALPVEETVDGHNIRGKAQASFNKSMLAAGGVQSCVTDMLRYAGALLRKGAGIVTPETFAAMTSPQYCLDPRMTHWGLAFSRYTAYGPHAAFGHGGAYYGGWNTNLTVLPDDGLAIVQQMNAMLDKPSPIFQAVVRSVLGYSSASASGGAIAGDLLASAPGVYEMTPGRLTNFRPSLRMGRVQLSARGGELWMHARRGGWTKGVRLVPETADDPLFLRVDDGDETPDHVLLTRGPDGRVDGFVCEELVRMTRTNTVAPWA